MYTIVLALIVAYEPYPTFAFLDEFETLADCQQAIERDVPKDAQEFAGCMTLVKPEHAKKLKGV
jgi:hypothetical protein